jgi:hypothetical protein
MLRFHSSSWLSKIPLCTSCCLNKWMFLQFCPCYAVLFLFIANTSFSLFERF